MKLKTAPIGAPYDFFVYTWKESWTFIDTVVDAALQPILILDTELRVVAANESFYRTFRVHAHETERILLHELGSGQWGNPALERLLKATLRTSIFFKGFEVAYSFPYIGEKVFMLQAQQIYQGKPGSVGLSPTIMLAMEDITELVDVAKMLANKINTYPINTK